MNRIQSSLGTLAAVAVALTLSGCGTSFVSSVTTTPSQAPSPAPVVSHDAPVGLGVQDYGGHAPLVGAHVYLVQLGAPAAQVAAANTPQTYGSVVKSLLTIAGKYTTTPVYSGTPAMPYTYPLASNVNDQFVPATDLVGSPFKYVTTNQYGEVYITGDYVCDPGYPVVLIGYGGSPSYYGAGAGSNTFTVSQMQVQTVSGVNVFTYTTSTNQLFYPGETVTVGGFTGGLNGYNQTGTVQASGLTSTQFTIVPTTPYTGGGQTATLQAAPGGVTAVGTPTSNPAATNMAMLGLCPAGGNFTPGQPGGINYIYMNEVSTTAAAYTLAQFTNIAATNQTGNDEFHIGAPTGNLTGLQNAAVTAGLLYDIQGSNTATTGGFDGENHTARSTTPCPTLTAGQACAVGTVPQAQIDMIANSLAACVDSNNTYVWTGTYVAPSNNQSTACKTLFQYAEDNGYYDTTAPTHYAFNIAQAAFNLARFPQGLGTATTAGSTNGGVQTSTPGTSMTAISFVNAIYTLPAGSNTPFLPAASTVPNDLAIGIVWADAAANSGTATVIRSITPDFGGNLWASGPTIVGAGTAATNTVFSLSPSGAFTPYTGVLAPSEPQVALDASTPKSNGYAPTPAGFIKFTPGSSAGTVTTTTGSTLGRGVEVDAFTNYLYVANNANTAATGSVGRVSTTTGLSSANFPVTATSLPSAAGCFNYIDYLTTDNSNPANVWVADAYSTTPSFNSVCKFSSTGTLLYSFALPSAPGGYTLPHSIVTDAGNNAWFVDKNSNVLYRILSSASGTQTTGGTGYSTLTSTNLNASDGVAVDGSNSIWTSSVGNGSLGHFNNTAPPTSILPTYVTGAATTLTGYNDYTFVTTDQAGNVWTTANNEGLLVQYVGMATPTVSPLAYAKLNGLTGGKPGLSVSNTSAFKYPAGDQLGSCPAVSLAVAFPAAVSFTVGETVLLSGFPTNTYLNGHMLKICALSGTQNIRGTFVDGFVPAPPTNASIAEAGAASAVN